jgi:hypothetical protein
MSAIVEQARLATDAHCEGLAHEPTKEYSDAYFYRLLAQCRASAPSREAANPYAAILAKLLEQKGLPRLTDEPLETWAFRTIMELLAGREAAPLDERALFESAWLATHPEASFPRREDGSYLCRSMGRLYEGWRLARAALAQPAGGKGQAENEHYEKGE